MGNTERFKMPSDEQLMEFAILFNEGAIEPEKLGSMVAMSKVLIERLHENGDVLIPSANEITFGNQNENENEN